MLKTLTYIYITTLIVLAVSVVSSCKNNFKNVQNIGVATHPPIGVAETINLKYTDSGKLKANLISPKMIDFSNLEFAYNEFPNGVVLHLFDDNANKSTVISDYAIVYDATNLIDLQGNVVLSTHQKDTLFAEQMYYHQTKEWLFTNLSVTFKKGADIINGKGFDSDLDFTQAEVLEIDGIITIDSE